MKKILLIYLFILCCSFSSAEDYRVTRVVDGDTIVVLIDCGFGIRINQRLRLRNIDTPELTTPKGVKAKQFVESKLKPSPFVIIKTYGSDKYDRYLVDVFYLKGKKDAKRLVEQGKFLNQELLDQGLAKVME